jgi:hypothetical protein
MASGLKFDEFLDKLHELKQEFRNHYGKPLVTIDELESYLRQRKMGLIGRRRLRSLKGFNI